MLKDFHICNFLWTHFSEDVKSEEKKKPEYKKHGVGGDRLSLEPLNLNKVAILFKLYYDYLGSSFRGYVLQNGDK